MDREEIDALESLKSTHQIVTSSVQNELLLVQSKLKNLSTDHELQKSHLIASMLAKEKLQQEMATLKEGKDSDSDETNAALKALKEVSRDIDPQPEQLYSPHLSYGLPFDLDTPEVQDDHHAMLARERNAIGTRDLPEINTAKTITHFPTPTHPSPSLLRPFRPHRRRMIFRLNKWTDDEWEDATTVADINHSTPRNKNKSFKTSNSASVPQKKPERKDRRYCLPRFQIHLSP